MLERNHAVRIRIEFSVKTVDKHNDALCIKHMYGLINDNCYDCSSSTYEQLIQ